MAHVQFRGCPSDESARMSRRTGNKLAFRTPIYRWARPPEPLLTWPAEKCGAGAECVDANVCGDGERYAVGGDARLGELKTGGE